ncbi:MAG: efflux RND transporter periplasmic adaptor subunit [Asticcacaulis sp.]
MNYNPKGSAPLARPTLSRGRLLIVSLMVAGVVFTLSGGLLWQSSHDAGAAEPAQKSVLTVALGMPREQVWPHSIEASGAIMAYQETIISAQIGGIQLRDVRVNVGDRVTKGQVLATFDPATPRAELARLTAALEQAEATQAQAMVNRNRAEALSGSGAISDQEVLRYVTEADTARAVTRAAQAALAAQREQLSYVEVRAPEDGVIVSRSASSGAVGGVGLELFRMIPQERLEWRGELTAAHLAQVSVGQSVQLSLPDGSIAQARLRQIAPSLDPVTRMGLIYADITGAGTARAGMYVGGYIRLPDQSGLTVPASSLVRRDGRHYLLVAQPKGKHFVVKTQEVAPGRYYGSEVEILNDGLNATRIIVTGAGFLKDGDLVTEAPQKANATKPNS